MGLHCESFNASDAFDVCQDGVLKSVRAQCSASRTADDSVPIKGKAHNGRGVGPGSRPVVNGPDNALAVSSTACL